MKSIITILICALIGYVTNYIAIKMLFRPYKEIRIFGFRIPFTPGVIPKGKSRIAKSVSEVIDNYIITKDSIKEIIKADNIRINIKNMIKKEIISLSKSSKSINEVLKDLYIKDNIIEGISNSISDYLTKDENKNYISKEIKFYCNNIKDKKIKDIIKLSKEDIDKIIINNDERIFLFIEEVINKEENQKVIKNTVCKLIKSQLGSLATMFLSDDVIGEKAINSIKDYVKDDYNKVDILRFISSTVYNLLDLKVDYLFELLKENKEFIKLDNIINTNLIKGTVNKLVNNVMEDYLSRPLSTFNLNLKEDLIDKVVDSIINKFYTIVDDNIEEIIKEINIKDMVENKINQMDLVEGEKIILEIVSKELRAITLFGAILGGVMGIFTIIINVP